MAPRTRRGLTGLAAAGLAATALTVLGPATPASAADCKDSPAVFDTSTPPALGRLGFSVATGVATGAGVLVAVVDSGVATANPHLTAAVVPGTDLTGIGGNATGTLDTFGHGTAIAGEIAARPVPGSGVVGLAPAATILPVRVYTEDPADDGQVGPDTGRIAAGIRYAADRGAQIINVSLSSTVNDPALAQAVDYATAHGSLVVASAGNRNTTTDDTDDPRYPAAYDDVLTVAAVDGSDNVTDDTISGTYIDVAAPGTDILTAFQDKGDCLIQPNDTQASTSYATGYVSAAAALVAQEYPAETPAQWKYRLEVTAARTQPGQRDDKAGWGIIQPYEALTFVADGLAAGPSDPARTPTAATSEPARSIPRSVAVRPDHTARNQALGLGLGGIVVAMTLALVAILRRDRSVTRRLPPRPSL